MDALTAHPSLQETSTRISHIADVYNRYAGELVRFSTLLEVGENWGGGVLSVFLPNGMELVDYNPLGEKPGESQEGPFDAPRIEGVIVRDLEDGISIDWCLYFISPGEKLEFITRARVQKMEYNAYLTSQAVLRDSIGNIASMESAQVATRVFSSYMKYLPEIYSSDDLMNRLLMLIESFWKPISQQINQPDVYYDPNLTPPRFLNWLASWVGIPLDEGIPVDRKRKLLSSALKLYQRSGTKQAMEDYLTLYTGGKVEIYEHRAQNLILGSDSHLGLTVALGTDNFPHTFTVKVTVPRRNIPKGEGEENINVEKYYRRKLETLIEAQKPAHTAFTLHLQIVD